MGSRVIWNAWHSIPTCFPNNGIPKLKWHNSTPQKLEFGKFLKILLLVAFVIVYWNSVPFLFKFHNEMRPSYLWKLPPNIITFFISKCIIKCLKEYSDSGNPYSPSGVIQACYRVACNSKIVNNSKWIYIYMYIYIHIYNNLAKRSRHVPQKPIKNITKPNYLK